MHTLEQAKELWCPMARVAMAHKEEGQTEYTIDPAVYNRVAIKAKPTTIPKSCVCMADRCATWRWAQGRPTVHTIKDPNPETTAEPSARPDGVGADWEFVPYDEETATPAQWVETQQAADQTRRRGYCGMAPLHAV